MEGLICIILTDIFCLYNDKIGLLFFLEIIAFIILFSIKITKQEIANYYGITRPTLGKWIESFSSKMDYSKYKVARKLSLYDFMEIINELGEVEKQKPLSKGTIKELCDTRYQTIRENISLKYCGITKEIYAKMDVFPPIVSNKILGQLS